MKNFTFIKSFFSPFKRPKLKLYIGKVTIGTPYFLPRRWRNPTKQYAKEMALKKYKEWGLKKLNNNKIKIPNYEQIYNDILRSKISVSKKVGFDFVGLGWKTKWDDKDYRFEWSPLISFVFFGLQIVVMVIPPKQSHYWEAWLYYENNTDKTKSKTERIKQCREEFPMKYEVTKNGDTNIVDYYNKILKCRFNNEINILRDKKLKKIGI